VFRATLSNVSNPVRHLFPASSINHFACQLLQAVERVGEVVKPGAFANVKQALEGVGDVCVRALNQVVKPTVLGAQAVQGLKRFRRLKLFCRLNLFCRLKLL
jgi:hypothetical protein